MNRSIFINYRRDDTTAEALLVRNALIPMFGEKNVFLDVSAIEAGTAWPEAIRERLDAADVVVAIIGPDWLRAGSDEWGMRRIDQDADWVRQELEVVLGSNKKLVPIFVRGAKQQIPRTVLPQSLQRLSELQGICIRSEFWDHDLKLLLANLNSRSVEDATEGNFLSPFPVSDLLPPDKLSEERLAVLLQKELRLWKKVSQPFLENPAQIRQELFRELRFQSFAAAITFMNQVAAGCDVADHHPRWENIYKTIRVYLSTWDGELHAVTDRDVQLARYFDRAYDEFPGKSKSLKASAEGQGSNVRP